MIWKLEFKERKSGENKRKIAPHYHLFVYAGHRLKMIEADVERGAESSASEHV